MKTSESHCRAGLDGTALLWRAAPSVRCLAGLILGIGVLGSSLAAESPAVQAQAVVTSASEAPAAWRAYGIMVQRVTQQWLSADGSAVQGFQAFVQDHAKRANGPTTTLAKVWITPDGTIERIEFEGLGDGASRTLRATLTGRDVGLHPPPDMLQPLRLKLTLGDKT